ncbi:solute carrier family 23 protein, partial [Streptomyces cuspidosporus]|uniref:solute carrier family 23 protein n=1 Tax=Streptomyces cuspidosporus TaxID=66882 RepID=UPI0031FCFC54
MKAVVYRAFGGTEVLEVAERPVPEPGPGEVRIAVEAAAVNPIDLGSRSGFTVQGASVTTDSGKVLLRDVSFASVGDSSWFGVTTPFFFGWPKFAGAAIVSMIVVMLITAVETTGDVFATGEIVDKRVGKEDVARALRADGLAT